MTNALTATAKSVTSVWNLDPAHSVAEFKVRHMMISYVKGQFTGITGALTLNESDIARSRVVAAIDASSINTREKQRDDHLKSADFFDVEHFPSLTFRSTKVRRTRNEQFQVSGELTIHGVSREVTFQVEGDPTPRRDPWGGTRLGLSATANINRKDFGLGWNTALEAGGILVGEEVTITLDIEFIKAADQETEGRAQ